MLGKDIVKFIKENELKKLEIQIKFEVDKDGFSDYRTVKLSHLGDSGDKVVYIEGHHLGSYRRGLKGQEVIDLIEENKLEEYKVNIGFEAGMAPNVTYLIVLLEDTGDIRHENDVAYLDGKLFLWFLRLWNNRISMSEMSEV